MHVEQLEARGFRNLAPLALELTSRPVALVGGNAQGKTNVLEALGLCTTGRSFRAAAPYEMLRHGEEAAQLRARLVRHDVRHDIEVTLTPKHRLVRVDGRALRQTSALLQIVNIVSFFPDDLRVVKGSPEERRRFLDRAVANHRADFVEAAQAYVKALRSRNALLRGTARLEPALVEVYDEQLVTHGELVHRARQETLRGLAPLAAAAFASIMPETGPLGLQLDDGIRLEPQGTSVKAAEGDGLQDGADRSPKLARTATDFAARLREGFRRTFAKDRARGVTSVGPHRAEVRMTLGGKDARLYASQGQQRAVVLALKMAELRYVEQQIGSAPILLLDDVSSELDSERTRLLFAAVATLSSQVWVTTTGAVRLPLPSDTQEFFIQNGMLEGRVGAAPRP